MAKKKADNVKRSRLNLWLSDAVVRSMDRLQEISGAESKTETIRRALSLYDIVLTHCKEGGSLVLRRPDDSEELVRIL